jgi:hypothetical protein
LCDSLEIGIGYAIDVPGKNICIYRCFIDGNYNCYLFILFSARIGFYGATKAQQLIYEELLFFYFTRLLANTF